MFPLFFISSCIAAFISGSAGFGGALLLLPLLVAWVGPADAVPLLTVAQLVGNFSRVGFGFSKIQWKPVFLFLLGAIPLSALGAFSFVHLPKEIAVRFIGIGILLFVIMTFTRKNTPQHGPVFLVGGGGIVGLLSGLVGSAGPLGAAIFLTLRLNPVAYVASEATTALVIHAVKMVVYQRYLEVEGRFWLLACTLSLGMVLGTWLARHTIERLSPVLFRRYVVFLLLVISLYMIVWG